MDKMRSSDPKKDEDFMLMTGVAYHALCKSADLLDGINIRPWENKKTIKQNIVVIVLSKKSILKLMQY